MFILYAYDGAAWVAFAKLTDKRGTYLTRVAEVAAIKDVDANADEERNSAKVMRAFVCEDNYFNAKKDGKVVKRALRHFDEVGISNDIYDALEELLDEGFDRFALAKDGQDVSTFTLKEITVKI